jgi:hypothetical protein
VTFESVYGAGTEGVRDDLSLAAMLCSISYVEDAWDAGDESLVVNAGLQLEEGCGRSCCHSLFQESIPVSIYRVQAFGFCD